jgi:soluble lytic murein transglycosylase-like protein
MPKTKITDKLPAWTQGPAKELNAQLLGMVVDAVRGQRVSPEDAMRAAVLLPPRLLELMRANGWIAWGNAPTEPVEPPEPSSKPPFPSPVPLTRSAVEALIQREAATQGVPVAVALAFADIESSLKPNAEGDLTWHERDNGARYKKYVLANKRLVNNPARLEPKAWHSYGLFQLLAPWHVDADQHPRSLLDPATNARKGVAAIKRALKQAKGNPYAARLAYVGCGVDGSACDADTVRNVREKLRKALAKREG